MEKTDKEKLEEAQQRVRQLEDDYKSKGWLMPPEPDPNLAVDEWWAVFSDYKNTTTGYISKIQPIALLGSASLFKVKRIL